MKPTTPHDPLDDLIAAALHDELTPQERADFELRLETDPAARAAYQESQLMHDLLEKTHAEAQLDPAFEQRMVSGVRRKIQSEERHRETAWESLVVLWRGLSGFFRGRRLAEYAVVCGILMLLAGVALGPITNGLKTARGSLQMQQKHNEMLAKEEDGEMRTNSAVADYAPAVSPAPALASASVPADSQNVPESTLTTTTTVAAPMAPITESTPAATPSADMSADRTAHSSSVSVTTAAPGFYSRRSAITKMKAQSSADQFEALMPINKAILAPSSTSAGIDASSKLVPPSVPTDSVPARKLIRNAQLDLEVKSFQTTVDAITAQVNSGGGYVDTSNSQRGGNGKLQGTIVVKMLPQNLDAFLLKLRDLGEIKNQSVSTDDVTKEYYDTSARLDNSRRMEAQLQDLLKHANSKVSDLLQVERELARVRGEIEQMQGQLKLYDFQVQYATVTISVAEKDLTQAAAYLLKERDEFSLFATNVEATFQQARQASDDFKAHILNANLNHNSGSDVSALLVVSVPPEQIEAFLDRVRTLGRVENFTRQTERVARDGGETDQPADQTLTEKDRVLVHLSIRSDDESRKQVALTVVTSAVDQALDQAKATALASSGAEVLTSSLNKTPQGATTAQLSVRVPGKGYQALLDAFRALGRTSSFSLQRDDNSGPNAAGDDAPVIIALALTDDETPLQQTEVSVLAEDVDAKAQQLKKDAANAGVEVKSSSFERQPDGRELAQMTFRLPLGKYPAFVESLKKLGRVESLSVHREDRPDQARTDDGAPAEINLQLHNEGQIVADDNGLWATLRRTFGEGAEALMGSVRTIGVLVAFLAPWVIVLGLLAWVGRRIYVARKK